MEGPRLPLDAASVWTIGAGLTVPDWSSEDSCGDGNFGSPFDSLKNSKSRTSFVKGRWQEPGTYGHPRLSGKNVHLWFGPRGKSGETTYSRGSPELVEYSCD